MMKIKLIYSLIATLLFMGCSESYDAESGLFPTLTPRYLSVSTSTLNYTSAKSEQDINIKSVQTPWKLENSIKWISLSSLSGSSNASVNVGVSENLDGDLARTGVFYLKADMDDWKYESPISVIQEGAQPSIILSEDYFDFNGKSNTGSVNVTANCKIKIHTDNDWITANYNTNIVNFSITPNETQNYREGQISLTNSNASIKQIITINQAPATINASTESLVFNNYASEVEITINSESNWAASTSNSWIDITPTSGKAGTSKMKISVSPNTSFNERHGNIILSIGETQCIQIPIRQRGIFVEVEQTKIQYAATGGTESISVLSNTSWEVTSFPDWITIDNKSGEGNGTIKATASDNPNTTSRSGQIHIQQKGLSIDCIVSVIQSGKTFEVNSTILNFDDKQSTQSVDIESDGTWYASSNNEWITATPSMGSGNSSLSISVTENTDENERQGTVSVRLGDKTSIINIVQKGKYFTIDNSILTYNSTGGSIKIGISTNDTWTAKVEDDTSWLKLSATTGNGSTDIAAIASDNPSVNKRTATIILETIHHQSIQILVTQNPRFLTVDTNEVLFYYKGGDAEPITISTDGQYKVTQSDSWFTTTVNNNRLIINAQRNKTEEPRIGFVTIELTDLTEGTLSLKLRVTQLNYGGSFIRKGFNPDENYDKDGETIGNLTITTFDDDKNWDSPSSNGITLSVSGYMSDSNWDTSDSSGLTVNRTEFTEDKDYDNTSTSSGSITRNEYEDDQNWN